MIVQCSECENQFSVKAVKGAAAALKKRANEEAEKRAADPNYQPPPLQSEGVLDVQDYIPMIGEGDRMDTVRAVSLKQGGKAALERARAARRAAVGNASNPPEPTIAGSASADHGSGDAAPYIP